jgi:HK97 gp10 family phage protein
MGKMTIQMPAEFAQKLSQLGARTDEITQKALQAGGEVVLDKVRSNLAAVVGHGTKYPTRTTGELQRALGISPPKLDRDGNFNVRIGFDEPRPDGNNNAKIAGVLEYGKVGQPPKPFIKPAKTQSRKAAIAAMSAKFEEEVDKI